jgi:hypothetical protein
LPPCLPQQKKFPNEPDFPPWRCQERGFGLKNEAKSNLAPRCLGKEDGHELSDDSATFRWDPAGIESRPVEPGRQPEASLAWWWSDPRCEA